MTKINLKKLSIILFSRVFNEGKSKNKSWKKEIPMSDSFKIFLENILNDINSNKTGYWFDRVQDTYIDYSNLSKEVNKWRKR